MPPVQRIKAGSDSYRPPWSLQRLLNGHKPPWLPFCLFKTWEGGFLGDGENDSMLLCLAPSWIPQMPLTFSIFWALLWNSSDVVDSIRSQSQIKRSSGGKLEAYKGLVSAHVAHGPLLGIAQDPGFPSRQLPSTVCSLIPMLFIWMGKLTLYHQDQGLSPGRILMGALAGLRMAQDDFCFCVFCSFFSRTQEKLWNVKLPMCQESPQPPCEG